MKRTRPEDAERSHLHSWLKELDVEPDLLLGELGGGDEEPDQPTTGGGSRPRAPSNHLSTCHGALLLGGVDHFVETPGQRVCPACQAMCRMGAPGGRGQVFVNKARVRLLTTPVGTWSKARDFYTRWEALPGVNALARRFPLAGAKSGASVIVFKSAEQASLLDQRLGPTGTLQPLAEDPAFTMCSRAKTFCPCCNFASSAGRGCVMHSTAMRAMRSAPNGDDVCPPVGGSGEGDNGSYGEDDLGLSALSPANTGGSGQNMNSALSSSELSNRRPAEMSMQQEMEDLVALLPAQYVMSTTLHDRLVHLQLLKRLRAQPELQVLSTWTQYTDRIGTEGLRQHLIFRDRPGSLGAVTGVLSKVGVNILEAAVFCTADGYALDIFSLSTPNPSLAALCDDEIRKFFLQSPPDGPFLSPTATPSTSAQQGAQYVDPNLVGMTHRPDAPPGASAAQPQAALQAAGGMDVFGADDSQFDDMSLTSLIAEGGMTRVWRGEWKGNRVAVKILNQGGPSISPEALRSFVQEIRILRELRHASICSFLGTCMQQGLPAIVLEYLSGGPLHNLLHETPAAAGADGAGSGGPAPLAPALLSRMSLEVAQGVAYLHHSQVIHRDIKSSNVLLDANQHAKVTDFGISTRFALDHTAETGTYRYMAPEVIAHQQYDYRCDVYSYGMLLWEIVHQQIPFRSQNALQAAFAVAMEQKRPPLTLAPPLDGFGPVIMACWHSSAEQRPDMDRVVQELTQLDAIVSTSAP